ncbi:hypothetical protein [Ligilactobacillus salivarius]|uniref:hypothetical protein n=1 Tax=Ligilactobacillus salivarius TaxID=1624 RepID=UPI00117A89E9|nr:hypothetical protein [Ligilactobacillus salivarius]
MGYRIYNGKKLLGDVNNKSTGINGLLPATSYQLGVTNYNGNRESPKTTINVKTRGIRLIIPTSLTVNSIITLNYQEYSLGLVPIGTEPAGMFGGGNKRDIQAKVISVDDGKSTVELLEPLESSSTVSIGGINLAKNTSDKLVNVIASPWLFVGSASSKTFNNLPDYQGKYMTVRVWIENPSEDSRVQIWTNKQTIFGNTIKAGQSGYSTASGIIPTGFIDWNLPVGNNSNNKITFGWKEFKIELGNIATPWSPAPEDTQYIVDNTQMNRLQDGSFAAFNGYRAIYFRK